MSKLNEWLTNPMFLRTCFYFIWIASVLLNSLIQKNDGYLYVFYILAVICLGAGYYNKPNLFLASFTTLVVLCRFFLIPDSPISFLSFSVYLLTYLLITFLSAGFMRNVQKVKSDAIELTSALVNALDSRDPYTLHHSENVSKYAVQIAKQLKFSSKECDNIRIGGLLHDIGKIGIPEQVLAKPGKLTDEEYELIKSHPRIGYQMIRHVEGYSKSGILDIILYHHERYDGKGYPIGLKGEDIPLVARIVAVADTFDAMTSKRVYREEFDLSYALEEIRKHKGSQFDPEIADAFLALFEDEQFKLEPVEA